MQSQEDTDVVTGESRTGDVVQEGVEPVAPSQPRGKFLVDMSILIAVLVAAGVSRFVPLRDNDTFWHILAGRHLLGGGSFHGPDPFNTMSSRPWVLHEWAPEVAMALAERHGGRTGLILLTPILLMVLLAVVYVSVRRWVRVVPAIALTGLVYVAVAPNAALRPQLAGYVLGVLLVGHLFESARRDRTPWWSVLLVWLWANSHGYWSIGAVVILACALGLVLDGRRRLGARFLLVGLVSIGAAALTPVGPALLRVPFEITGYGEFVTEWQPPSLASWQSFGMLALVVPTFLIWFRGKQRPSWMLIVVMGVAVVLQLLYIRTGAVAACIGIVAIAVSLSWHAPARLEPWRRAEWGAIGLAMAIGIGLCLILAPTRTGIVQGKPTGLDGVLSGLPADSKVCNDYALGGWLLWRHPTLTVAIDPRTELYPLPYVRDYVNFMSGSAGWDKTAAKLGCEYTLFSSDSAITGLLDAAGWTGVATQDHYTLMRRP